MKKVFSRKAKALTLVLSAALILAIALPFAAKRPATTFSDLATNHWAYADIMALYQGGLVNGMGGGKFGADRKLTVSEIATMIANAQGIDITTKGGEAWYVPPMRHAVEIGILPSNTDPTSAEAASKECSREQAVSMVIAGLGISSGHTYNDLDASYIPDFGQVDIEYRDNILRAYRYGIIKGKDTAHTFAPKDILTRGEICAILNRAGYNEAKEVAKTTEGGRAGQDAYDRIKATGLFEETVQNTQYGTSYKLVAKDRKYAQIEVLYADDCFSIEGKDFIYALARDETGNVYDEAGNIAATERSWYDANGKYIPPSCYAYTSRQLLKQILGIIFPNEGDKAYAAFMTAITPPHTYADGSEYPSALGWFDNRCMTLHTSSTDLGGYSIDIYRVNDKDIYEEHAARPAKSGHFGLVTGTVSGQHTHYKDVVTAYELDRW